MVEKVIKDGMVAVLVSYGYGAGWVSWANDEHKQKAAFHPKFIDWVEGGKKGDIDEIVKEVFGDNHFYTGGSDGLSIEWIPLGTQFKIDEYDGAESLETRDGTEWMTA